MGLAKCLDLAKGITKAEKQSLLNSREVFINQGLSELEADRKAVQEMTADLEARLASFSKAEETKQVDLSALGEDSLNILDNFDSVEFDEFDSIIRLPALDNLETKYGVRIGTKLKKFPNTQYKKVTARAAEINKELKANSADHQATVVRIRAKNRTYLGIQISIASKQGDLFDSFKRTKEAKPVDTFGKTIGGQIYITNLPLYVQNSAVESITNLFLNDVLKAQAKGFISESEALSDAVNKKYNSIVKSIKEFEEARKSATGVTLKKIETILPYLTIIRDNYGPIANMAIRAMSATNLIDAKRFTVSMVDNKPTVKSEETQHSDTDRLLEQEVDDNADGLEDLEQSNENTLQWQAEGSIKVDSKKTISQELKLFLTDIRGLKNDGTPESNFFGDQRLMPFDTVYNVLSRILSNKTFAGKNGFEQMIEEIESHTSAMPFLRDVVDKLRAEAKNDRSKIPYQFQRAMVKHKVDMFYLGFSYRTVKGEDGKGKGKRYFITPVDSNSSYNAKIISDNWFSDFRMGKFVTIDEHTADDTITDSKFKDLKLQANNKAKKVEDAYKKYNEAEEDSNKEELRESLFNHILDALELVGITPNSAVVNDMIDGRLRYFKNEIGVTAVFKRTVTTGSSGHYMRFISAIGKRRNGSLSTNNPFSHNFAEALAEHESKYNSVDASNSYTDETGKSIYTYSNFKYIVERAVKLLENNYIDANEKTRLLDHLKSVPFIANSSWLEQLERGDLNSSNFRVKYADSIVDFNKKGSGKKVKDAPVADIELYKLGLFMNRGFTSGDNKSVTYVYPTLSDGGTIMEVSALAEDIILNDNNTLGTGTLDKMYNSLVQPEVARIRDFQAKGNTDIKGYDQGANKFLFLPNLNDEALGLFVDGKLKTEFTEEDMDNIHEVLNSYATNLIDNKIKEWMDFGILRHSNAILASTPIIFEKNDLVTEKSIEKTRKWKGVKYAIKTAKELNNITDEIEGYSIEDVVYVYETDDENSLNSVSAKNAKVLYNLEAGKQGLTIDPLGNKASYGISVKPNVEETGNEIKTKNELIAEYRKLVKSAEANPSKLYVLNVGATLSPRTNHSGYSRYNLAEVLANVKLPDNVVIKENLAELSLKAADNLRKTTKEKLQANHEKAKLSVYKDQALNFVDEQYYKDSFGENGEIVVNKPYYVAASYVLNYMIANANIHQLFIGDPALYYKESKQENATELDHVKLTFDNISKRLAGDRAPGEFMADSFDPNERFKTVFIPDRTIESKARAFMESLGYDYSRITSTDAQEFTTLKEDLYVRYKMGMITKSLYDALYNPVEGIVTKELAKGNYDYYQAIYSNLKGSQLKEFKELVLQPMKPVYVNNVAQDINGQKIDRRVYIKTSAFALSPSLTRNKEIDKLRIYMEKNGIDRVAFESGVKVGDSTKTDSIEFFNEDGTINIDETALNDNTLELPRDGFRIQQEIPFKEDKVKVKFGVQESALLFANIADETIDGTPVKELKNQYDEAYMKLYKNAAESVYEELGIPKEELANRGLDKNNIANIDQKKLSKLIYNEALNRGYSPNELQALGITEGNFNLRLAFHSRGLSLETVLNSIITNRVIKQKFYGKGFILGTQEGFQYLDTLDKEIKDNIIYTSDTVNELLPMGFRNAEGKYVGIEDANKEGVTFQPAQVYVPSILKDANGNSIDLFEKENGKWKYLIKKEKRLVLNHKTVDPSILKMFGFRIPTQGHNSMAYIEIAGFLPKAAGDLIIAPRDFVTQMGSDFDVDKLYSYMYNIEVAEDGKIKKVDSSGESSEAIKNKILDIHFKILSSSNKKIQQQIFEPLGFGILKSEPGEFKSNDSEIEKIVNEQYESNLGDYIHDLNDTSDREFTGLSDMYQRDTFLEGRDGAVGIGVFSLNSTMNASIQNTTMTIGQTVNKKEGPEFVEHEVWFGENKSNSAYVPTTHEGGKLQFDKSQVISWYQSASVDNAKEKVLFKLNINSDTFGAIAYLNQIGFHEEALWFINQPIIRDYVRQKQISSSSIAVGNNNIDIASKAINLKYKKGLMDTIKSLDAKGKKINFKDGKKYDVNTMHELLKAHKSGIFNNLKDKDIKTNEDAIIFYKSQLAILSMFKEYEKRGNHLQNLQNVLNSNSKGAGKNLSEAHIKAVEISELANSKVFDGADQLVGEYVSQTTYNNLEDKTGYINMGQGLWIKPTTIQGYASIYGTSVSSYLFNSMFPYGAEPVAEAVDLINDISSHNAQSIGNRAKNVNQIWTELKKFINSKALEETANFIPRRRLLLDEFDKDGNRISTSLATTINMIKAKKLIKNNAFFDGLKIRTSKSNNSFSTIEFNSNSENLDDNLIYQGFADLINNVRPIAGLSDPEYNTKKLADDLIKYSLMAGGVQQFNQFSKYIPFFYLEAIGYNEVINSVDFNDMSVIGYKPTEDYSVTPEFVTQYFQHFPDKAPEVRAYSEYVNLNSDEIVSNVNAFTVQKDEIINNRRDKREAQKFLRKRMESEEYSLVEFLTIRNKDNGKLQLYKLQDPINGVYVRISTLGSNGVSEYSYGNQSKDSYMATTLTNEESKLVVKRDETYSDPLQNDTSDTTRLGSAYGLYSGDVSTIMSKIVSNIKNRPFRSEQDNMNLAVAKELTKLISIFNVPVIVNNTLAAEGRYVKNKNHILINDKYIAKQPDSATAFERVFLHEYLHAITVKAVTEDKGNQYVSSLQGIITHTIDQLKESGIDVNKILNESGGKGAIASNNAKYLGLTNEAEFISEFFTNPEFRDLLSGIKYENKTVYDKIIETIIKIVNSFGINIPAGTAAEAGYINILAILDMSSNGAFYENLTTERSPVEGKNIAPAKAIRSGFTAMKAEDDYDSIIRSMIDEGRLEIHCKL